MANRQEKECLSKAYNIIKSVNPHPKIISVYEKDDSKVYGLVGDQLYTYASNWVPYNEEVNLSNSIIDLSNSIIELNFEG
ncbi:11914_t:CDS:1, partial [Racocetra persica]